MKVNELTSILLSYCNDGRSLDDIEILDSDGNSICILDSITLERDHGNEILMIKIHHKDENHEC